MKYNASAVQLSVFDGTPTPIKKLIAEQTKCSLKLGSNTIDITSKQNAGWEESLGGMQNGELTIEFLDDSEAGASEVNLKPIYDIWNSRSRPKWVLESTIVGTLNFEFYGLITSLDLNRDMESGAGNSITIKLTQRPAATLVV